MSGDTEFTPRCFDSGNDQAWAEEIDRRMAEIDSSQVRCIPADDVFANLRRRHDRGA